MSHAPNSKSSKSPSTKTTGKGKGSLKGTKHSPNRKKMSRREPLMGRIAKTTNHNLSPEEVHTHDNERDKDERVWTTERTILRLGKAFFEWCRTQANDPETRYLVTSRFWLERDIHPTMPYRWAKLYPEFKSNFDKGRSFIGCRKLEGVYAKELEPKTATFLLHQELNEWKKAEEFHADLKKQKDGVAALLGATFKLPDLERSDDQDKDTE